MLNSSLVWAAKLRKVGKYNRSVAETNLNEHSSRWLGKRLSGFQGFGFGWVFRCKVTPDFYAHNRAEEPARSFFEGKVMPWLLWLWASLALMWKLSGGKTAPGRSCRQWEGRILTCWAEGFNLNRSVTDMFQWVTVWAIPKFLVCHSRMMSQCLKTIVLALCFSASCKDI